MSSGQQPQSSFDATTSGAQLDLTGEWVGTYGSHGDEIVRLSQTEGTLLAVKVTGDANVPAGQVTWRACLESGQGEGQVAGTGFVNPTFVPARLQVLSRDHLVVTWQGWESIDFRRRGSVVDHEWGRSFLGRLLRRWFVSRPA